MSDTRNPQLDNSTPLVLVELLRLLGYSASPFASLPPSVWVQLSLPCGFVSGRKPSGLRPNLYVASSTLSSTTNIVRSPKQSHCSLLLLSLASQSIDVCRCSILRISRCHEKLVVLVITDAQARRIIDTLFSPFIPSSPGLSSSTTGKDLGLRSSVSLLGDFPWASIPRYRLFVSQDGRLPVCWFPNRTSLGLTPLK